MGSTAMRPGYPGRHGRIGTTDRPHMGYRRTNSRWNGKDAAMVAFGYTLMCEQAGPRELVARRRRRRGRPASTSR